MRHVVGFKLLPYLQWHMILLIAVDSYLATPYK